MLRKPFKISHLKWRHNSKKYVVEVTRVLCTPCGKGYYASIFTTMVGAKRDSVQVWSAEVFLKVFTPCGGKVVSQPLSFEDSLI